MKKKITFFLLIFMVVHVSGHEFWIQPDKFIYERTEAINLKFLVGENFNGNNWNGDKDNVNCLCLYYEDAVDKNLASDLGTDNGDSLQLAMIDEGTVMITLNTRNSFKNISAKEFNAYLEENNFSEALLYRSQHHDTLKNGMENYQRSVKTIFQVGDRYTKVYGKKTTLPLDIVPLDHPYNFSEIANFKLAVYFRGEKLKNASIKVWHKVDNKVTEQEYNTNDEGEANFMLSPEGEWMVSCVKMLPTEADPRADWQTYWGSLTWGYY